MKTKHTHVFILVRAGGSILRCSCGAWRHASSENAIVAIEAKPRKSPTSTTVKVPIDTKT